MSEIKLIALDLDGTLLDSEKRLPPRNRRALERAAAAGIEIVPATGRFFRGIPEEVRSLPFLHYSLTINGAEVWDIRADRSVYSSDIPLDLALEVFEYLDSLPVIYDCYQDGWGWITESMRDRAEDYIDYAPSLDMLRRLRSPVPELKRWLRERGKGVQKLQLFTRDRAFRDGLLQSLPPRFPELSFTDSLPNNLEINSAAANKGDALLALGCYLGLGAEQLMAFGDGLNDRTMLLAAGIGVAMGNAHPELLRLADRVTDDCDHDGVAAAIEKELPELFTGGIISGQQFRRF